MDQNCSEAKEVKLWEPAEAAVKLQRVFKRVARKLRDDYHLREDLVQEMSLAVLRCERSHSLVWFLSRAEWYARMFLKSWDRSKKPLEPLIYHDERFSYDPEVLEARRQAAIAEIRRRGFGHLLNEVYRLEQAMAETPQAA